MPELGPALGKGDAMWRALAVVRGEVVVYLDSDTRDFSPHFALGMLGPLLAHPELSFVKGFFRRPYLGPDGSEAPGDGGRVTELTARPLLSAFYPELAAFVQPLAGEVAARRSLLERIPFATGLRRRDRDAPSRARRPRRHRVRWHRWTSTCASTATSRSHELGPMAYAVLRVVLDRLRAEGRLIGDEVPPLQTAEGGLVHVDVVERPPLRHAPRPRVVAIRCVYTDLDGTLLGRGRVAVPHRRRRLHAARGAGARGVPPRRRGGRDQVGPPPRPGDGGRAAARPELLHLRGGRRHGDRRRGDLPHRRVRAARGRERARPDRGHRRARAAAARATRAASSTTRPFHVGREVSHVFRGSVDAVEANELLARGGPLRAAARGQRRDRPGHAHLPPDPGGASRRRARWRRTCARAATRARNASAVGDSREDLEVAEVVGRLFLVANAVAGDSSAFPNVERTEAAMSEGFYEAIIRSLAES